MRSGRARALAWGWVEQTSPRPAHPGFPGRRTWLLIEGFRCQGFDSTPVILRTAQLRSPPVRQGGSERAQAPQLVGRGGPGSHPALSDVTRAFHAPRLPPGEEWIWLPREPSGAIRAGWVTFPMALCRESGALSWQRGRLGPLPSRLACTATQRRSRPDLLSALPPGTLPQSTSQPGGQGFLSVSLTAVSLVPGAQ